MASWFLCSMFFIPLVLVLCRGDQISLEFMSAVTDHCNSVLVLQSSCGPYQDFKSQNNLLSVQELGMLSNLFIRI